MLLLLFVILSIFHVFIDSEAEDWQVMGHELYQLSYRGVRGVYMSVRFSKSESFTFMKPELLENLIGMVWPMSTEHSCNKQVDSTDFLALLNEESCCLLNSEHHTSSPSKVKAEFKVCEK